MRHIFSTLSTFMIDWSANQCLEAHTQHTRLSMPQAIVGIGKTTNSMTLIALGLWGPVAAKFYFWHPWSQWFWQIVYSFEAKLNRGRHVFPGRSRPALKDRLTRHLQITDNNYFEKTSISWIVHCLCLELSLVTNTFPVFWIYVSPLCLSAFFAWLPFFQFLCALCASLMQPFNAMNRETRRRALHSKQVGATTSLIEPRRHDACIRQCDFIPSVLFCSLSLSIYIYIYIYIYFSLSLSLSISLVFSLFFSLSLSLSLLFSFSFFHISLYISLYISLSLSLSLCGLSVVSLWSLCGLSVVSLWSLCGLSVVSLWSLCGLSVVSLWSLCGLSVVSLWSLCGLSVVSLWSLCGLSVVSLWSLCGLSVVSLWSLCGKKEIFNISQEIFKMLKMLKLQGKSRGGGRASTQKTSKSSTFPLF